MILFLLGKIYIREWWIYTGIAEEEIENIFWSTTEKQQK